MVKKMTAIRLLATVFFLTFVSLVHAASSTPAAPEKPDASACLGCHGNQGFEMPGPDGKMKSLHVPGEKFEKSVHAAFLVCVDCHTDRGEIPHKEGLPKAKVDCGGCHSDQKAAWLTSVHGQEAQKGNLKAATCSSCHTKHEIQHVATDEAKLAIVQNCGSCHSENLRSYTDTYHGQVNTLGYTYTAKCFDCHASHTIQRVKDPKSTVHPDNRLQTCQKCHKGATPGFVTFQPHANTHDFNRYPIMWVASKFMLALLAGVFAFFWLHSALWFYREYKDRKEGKSRPHVKAEAIPGAKPEKYYRRFALGWRIGHFFFALSVMTLVLTGMAVFLATEVVGLTATMRENSRLSVSSPPAAKLSSAFCGAAVLTRSRPSTRLPFATATGAPPATCRSRGPNPAAYTVPATAGLSHEMVPTSEFRLVAEVPAVRVS